MSERPWPPPKSHLRLIPHLPITRRLGSLSCRSYPQEPFLSRPTTLFLENRLGIRLRVPDGPDGLAICCLAFAASSTRSLECNRPLRAKRTRQAQHAPLKEQTCLCQPKPAVWDRAASCRNTVRLESRLLRGFLQDDLTSPPRASLECGF